MYLYCYVCVFYTVYLLAILHPGILFYISPVYGLFHHCVIVTYVFALIFLWMIYLRKLQYFCVLHRICSLVALHIGNLVMYISCILFVVPFSHPCWPTFTIVDSHIFVWISCHIHWSTYLCSYFLNISYIYFYYNFFCCFLLLGQLLTWNQ